MTAGQREIRRKRRVLEYAEKHGNINTTCRRFGIARSTFYLWRDRYRELGEAGIARRRRCRHKHPYKTPDEGVEKILHLRRTYYMGPIRIVWYLQRYHDIKTSDATVYRVCKRNGLNRLPNRVGRRAVHTHRYPKQVPGPHVQVDVKFLTLKRKRGGPVRRYQYTAIDFVNYVVKKFPFRIRSIRTDRGYGFQALFHWHVADLGMEHVYIKPRTPQLNGKVERSHRTDKDEFYPRLTYRDDVDLKKKLSAWEKFYNYDRPHGAHKGKTPYEALREKLS